MAIKKVAKKVVKKEADIKVCAKKTSKVLSKLKGKVKKVVECECNNTLQNEKLTINKANPNSYIVIDYPVDNEIISKQHGYVIKIGASKDGYVEISFNGSEWKPCRFASGYWWFDWQSFEQGQYKIEARLLSSDNKVIKYSDTRICKVK